MASSPRCPSCGYRALRFRKSVRAFRCTRCRNVFPVVASGGVAESLDDSQRRLALSAARARIDAAAHRVFQQHALSTRLIAALSVASAGIVLAVSLHSWAWYAAFGAAVGVAVLVYLVLFFAHAYAWAKEHPLLFRVYVARVLERESVHSSQDALQACIDVVRRYLPDEDRRELLGSLDEARSQMPGPSDAWLCGSLPSLGGDK
jgi:hypothetical protein